MLVKGAPSLVTTDNKYIVNALREIAAGKVSYAYEAEGRGAEAEAPRVKLVEKEGAVAKEDAD